MATLGSLFPNRPWLRRTVIVLSIVILMSLILLSVLRVLATNSIGHNFVEKHLEAMSASGQSVSLNGIEGDLLGRFSVDTLHISDEEGIWLIARDVAIDWSPFSLIKSDLKLKDVSVESLTLSRQPVISAQGKPARKNQRESPLRRYQLSKLIIRDMAIEAPLLQAPQNFSFEAAIDTDIESGDLQVDLTPMAETGDRVMGDLSWREGAPMVGKLVAIGPDGGLLTRLIDPIAEGGIEITFTGDSNRDNWSLDGSVEVAGAETVSLEAAGGLEAARMSGLVKLDAFGFLQDLAGRLGPVLQLEGDWRLEAPVNINLESAAFMGDMFATFEDGWSLDQLQRVRFAIDRADINRLTGIPEIELGGLTLKGNIYPEEEGWTIITDLDASRFTYLNYGADRLSGRVSASLQNGEPIATNIALAIAAPNTGNEQLDNLIGSSVDIGLVAAISAETNRAALSAISVETAAGTITARGETSFDLMQLSFDGAISATGQELPVAIDRFNWQIQRSNTLAIDVTADLRAGIECLPEAIRPWVDGPGDLSLALSLTPGGEIEISQLEATTSGLNFSADGTYGADSARANLKLSARAGASNEIAFNAATFNLQLYGELDSIILSTSLDADQLALSGEPIELQRAEFSGRFADTGFAGQTDLVAVLRGETIKVSGAPRLQGNIWNIEDLQALFGDLSVEGKLEGDLEALDAVTADLDIVGTTSLLPGEPTIEGLINIEGKSANIDVTVQDMLFGTVLMDLIHLSGRGAGDRFNGQLSTVGSFASLDRALPFSIMTPLMISRSEQSAVFSPEGVIDLTRVSTSRQWRIVRLASGYELDGAISAFGGGIDIAAKQFVDRFEGQVRIEPMDLAAISALLGRPEMRGKLSGEVNLSGVAAELGGQARLTLLDIDREGNTLGAANIVMDAVLDSGVVKLTGRATGDDIELGLELALDARLPVKASAAPFRLAHEKVSEFTASVSGGGPVANLWGLIGPPETRLEGYFDLDAQFGGNVQRSTGAGSITFREGVFEDATLGVHLINIAIDTEVSSSGIAIRSFTADGVNGGDLSADGSYDFAGASDIRVNLDQLDALQRNDVKAIVSGDLSVISKNNGFTTAGDLVFDRVEIDIGRLPQSGYATLDVQFADKVEGQETNEAVMPIALDIGLSAPRRIFVSGKGLTSEWGGAAQLGGTVSDPQLRGTAEIVRGDVDLVGRNFAFKNSKVRFEGAPEEAELDIRAERAADGFTATIALTGQIGAPEFTLTSSPDLPQGEILSRVLFGRSPTQLSPLQAAQLAAAIASFSGNGALDPVGSLQDALGIDRFDFGISDEGEAQIGAGKYISENVYVELRTDVRGETGVAIEWTPRENIEVTTEVDADQTGRFDVRWRRDFDIGGKPQTLDKEEK